MEQTAVFKFYFKHGKCVTETVLIMEIVYKKNYLIHSKVFKWYALFKDGYEFIHYPGDPSTSITDEN